MEVEHPNEPPASPRGKGQRMLTNIRKSLLIQHRPSSPSPTPEEPDLPLLPEIDASVLNGRDIRRGMRRLSKKAPPVLRVLTQDLLGTLSSAEADKLQQENARTENTQMTPSLADKQTLSSSAVSPSSDDDLDLSLADVDELFRKSTIRFSQISLNASIDFSETDSTTTSYVKRMSYFSNNSSTFTGTSVTSNDDSLTSASTDYSGAQPLSTPVLPDPYTAFGGRKSMTLAPSRRYSMPYHTLMAISSKRPYARTRVDTLSEIDWSRAIGTVNGKRTSLPLLAFARSPSDEDDLEHEKGFAGLGEEDMDGDNEKESESELNDVEHHHDSPIHHKMDEKTLRKRFNIAMEILDTERYYVESMMLVERAFLAPLLNILDPLLIQNLHPALATSVSTPISTPTIPNFSSPILSRKEINDIFANFVDIISLNAEILRLLEARLIGPDSGETIESQTKEGVTWNPADGCLGDIFLSVAPFLKVYSNYVKNFNTALKVLSHCMQRNDRFRIFLAEQSHRENLRGLTLEGYLLMPVQRIPRYKLLLESLLENTPSEHPDHEKLSKAFGIIEEVAMFVNEMIRQHEMFMTMLGIQKGLVGFDEVLLIPGRRLIKTGVIRKICRKSHQPRIFFLFSDILIYASPTFVEGSFTFHRKFKLDRCSAVGADDTDNAKNIFQILSPEKSFAVYADSTAEKESWINIITQTKQELLDSMSTLRVDDQAHSRSTSHYRGYEFPVMLDYRAPVWIPDDATDNCQLCNEEFTLFRRKHHCRACGNVICYSCSTRNFIIPGRHESEDRLARACDSCFDMILEAQLAIELQRAARKQPIPNTQVKTIYDAPAASVLEHTSTDPLPLPTIASLERRGSLENISGDKLIRNEMLNRTGSGFLIKGQSSTNAKQPIRRSTTTRRSAGRQCDLCGSGFGVFRWKHMCDKCHRTVCADCLSKKPITATDIAELGMTVPEASIFSIKLCDPCHLGIYPGDVILRESGGWEVQEEEEEEHVRPVHRRSMSGSASAPPEDEPCSVV